MHSEALKDGIWVVGMGQKNDIQEGKGSNKLTISSAM